MYSLWAILYGSISMPMCLCGPGVCPWQIFHECKVILDESWSPFLNSYIYIIISESHGISLLWWNYFICFRFCYYLENLHWMGECLTNCFNSSWDLYFHYHCTCAPLNWNAEIVSYVLLWIMTPCASFLIPKAWIFISPNVALLICREIYFPMHIPFFRVYGLTTII